MHTVDRHDKKNTYIYTLTCKHTRCMSSYNQQQFACSCGLQRAGNGVGGGDRAGENLVPSSALKPLKATVLFSIEVVY